MILFKETCYQTTRTAEVSKYIMTNNLLFYVSNHRWMRTAAWSLLIFQSHLMISGFYFETRADNPHVHFIWTMDQRWQCAWTAVVPTKHNIYIPAVDWAQAWQSQKHVLFVQTRTLIQTGNHLLLQGLDVLTRGLWEKMVYKNRQSLCSQYLDEEQNKVCDTSWKYT